MSIIARAWLALAAAGALALAQGCATLPPPVERTPSHAIAASPNETLGRIALQSVPANAGSGFRPLPLSTWAMDARLTLVRQAQKTLDLQYYLLQNDVTGHTLLRAVRDAALRGVRVRLLIDDLYTADNDRMLLQLAAYPNVEIRLFNPFPSGRAFALTRWVFALGDFARVNHRMHNKMLIADGAFAVAGGRNIADEYFFSSKGGNFVDFDLLIAGAAVPRMAAIFDTCWNSPRIYPLEAIETGRDTPQQLRDEFERLTLDDEPFASAAYGRYRVAMLKMGATLYEVDSSQLKNDALIGPALQNSIGRSHSKLIVIDRRTTFVGSMNMDFRSSRVNTELGLLVESPALAGMVPDLAQRVRAVGSYRLRLAEPDGHLQWVATVNGVETVYDSEPGVDFATRLQLLLFPFISESLL